ncbi:serine carboxypeptidase [Sphaerosporella brunnea]|uniref:Serine carboxypeptidase n=1 Tax=Sphaerosporella brunnea TaxID=1250544 RepID=A0A5J5F545_9PEZI|nr:serine carboxypeptidase [Sphaerosporella brunnea]
MCSLQCPLLLAIVFIITLSAADYSGYPPPVTGAKTISKASNPGITITYKEPSNEICRTWNPKQKQYAGHVHIPPGTLEAIRQDYPINTFFWFVEARENPQDKPLTIWLNGGPGSSSMIGMMSEVGPCAPVPASKESLTTIPREFGWDAASNMLFIDQPNQVGFSYDTPTNGSLPLLDSNGVYIVGKPAPPYEKQPISTEVFLKNKTTEAYLEAIRELALINGTFPSGKAEYSANTTAIAAEAIWHFLQAWLVNFPQYAGSTGINLFAESYGGKYGPTFFRHFEKQNQRRESGELPKNETVGIHLASLGIVNGCIDALTMTPAYMHYAANNSYGIPAITPETRDLGMDRFNERNGCKDSVLKCRKLVQELDSNNYGHNKKVNAVCSMANRVCDTIRALYRESDRSWYDIAHREKDPFPDVYHKEYLNNATVLEAIGARTNFSQSNIPVFRKFKDTGDFVRGGQMEAIAELLQAGVRVALIYGDRDYICNWVGGEAASLAIDYPQASNFIKAGYQDIEVNSSYIGGQVRQHGLFSFSRIYQAGHLVPAYQPETSFRVFERIIKGLSVATGDPITDDYSTTGEAESTKTLVAPEPPEPTCFVRDITTCDDDHWFLLADKKGVIYNGVVYNRTEDYPEPAPLPPYPPGQAKADAGANAKMGNKTTPGGGGHKASGAMGLAPSVAALLVAMAFCIAML